MAGLDASLRRRALAFLRPYARRIAAVVFWTVVGGALPAVEPLAHKSLFDHLVAKSAVASLVPPLVALAALALAHQVLDVVTTLLAWRVRLGINRDVLAAATERLHALPLAYHQGRGVGETMTRIDRGITSFTEGLTCVAFQVAPAVVYLGVSAVIMLRMSPLLAAVAVLFVVPPLVLGGKARAALLERERAVLDRWCAIYNRFQEVLAGIKTVKAFAREADEHRQFIASVEGAQGEVLESIRADKRLSFGRGLCVNLGRVAVLGAGAVLVSRGQIGVGTLVAFLAYVGGLYGPAQALLGAYDTMRRADIGLEAIFHVLDAEDAVPDAPDAIAPDAIRGEVALARVTHRYAGRPRPALEDVDVTIPAGQFVAIVGRSGAGKSTLTDLVLRLFDPTAGAVRIDGHDVRRYAQRALRRRLGVVTQEPFLFEDTILANLRYGAPDATLADIEAAARVAQAHDFIAALPDAYATRVGRGGVQLSGGEKQRLSIARLVLRDPAILLVDEPTSALDVHSEASVHEALESLAQGRTTILVAHRLSTVARADRVIVLEDGRVVEDGPPAELRRKSGPYRRMIDAWDARDRDAPRPVSVAPSIA